MRMQNKNTKKNDLLTCKTKENNVRVMKRRGPAVRDGQEAMVAADATGGGGEKSI